MATSCVLYRLEGTDGVPIQAEAEARQNAGAQSGTQTTSTPDGNLRDTLQDQADVTSDLPTEEALRIEIDDLRKTTLSTDEAFCNIRGELCRASKGLDKHVGFYDTFHKVEAWWNECYETYQKLLKRSGEFAGEAHIAINDSPGLALRSLRAQDRTRSEKQEIIQEKIRVLQNRSELSNNFCQEFLDLARDLDAWVTEFSRVIDALGIEGQCQRVERLEDRLRAAKAPVATFNREVKESGWRFAGDFSISIALPLVFGGRTARQLVDDPDYTKTANSGLQFLEARRRYNLVATECEAAKAERDLESVSLDQMLKLQSAFNDSRPLVQEVTTGLGIFANIWAAITADMRKLKSALHNAEDLASPLFADRVERLEKMHGYLSQSLRRYQVMVKPLIPSGIKTFISLFF